MKRILAHAAVFAVLVLAFVQTVIASGEVFHISLESTINPITGSYVSRVIDQANSEGASIILLEISANGGLVDSAKEIIESIIDSDVPVVAYMPGLTEWEPTIRTMIGLAADVAVMDETPEPISESTFVPPERPENNVEESPDGVQSLESELATPPINNEIVSQIQNTRRLSPGEEAYINFMAAWAEEITDQSHRSFSHFVHDVVISRDVVDSDEAVAKKMVNIALAPGEDLMTRLESVSFPSGLDFSASGASEHMASMTFRESALNLLANPNLVYILLLVGIFGLIFEFMSGGTGIGLVAGGLALIVALMGLQVLPVNTVGVVLIIFGAILVLADVAYSASNGILTGGGVIALLVGSFTLYEFSGIGNSQIGLAWYNVIVTISALGGLFIFFVIKGVFVSTRQPAMGINAMIGLKGKTQESIDFDGEGIVFVHGEYWRAIPLEESIDKGEEIEVVAIENGRLFIRKHLEPKPAGHYV